MYEFRKGYWGTRDDKFIKIKDMETSHIKNTIRFLEANEDFYDECGGSIYDTDSMYYEDNSELVFLKIEELNQELKQRKG